MPHTPIDLASLLSSYVDGDISTKENSIWLVYAAVIIETISSASHISELWKYISSTAKYEGKCLFIARRIREGLLRASPLAGSQKGINCLAALRLATNSLTPSVGKILKSDKSLRASHSASFLEARGLAFFERVYGKVSSRVQENMALSSSHDLDQFAMLSIYGELMAEERILEAKETGLMEFVVCYVSGAAPQAKGHMYGARNLGNGKVEVGKGVRLCRELAGVLGVRVDEEGMGFVGMVEGW